MDHKPKETLENVSPNPMPSFLERMRKLSETTGSNLFDLYNDKGPDSPEFTDTLDDVVFSIAVSDEEYAKNMEALKSGRLKRDEAEEIARHQRATADAIRHMVVVESGLPTEEFLTDIQKAQMAVAERLEGSFDAPSDELLRRLGILSEDPDGGATFTYPADLFPQSVNDKWEVYLATVQEHLDAAKEVSLGIRDKSDVESADKVRKFAHDRITSDLHKILGFDQLNAEEWSFRKTRDLIAKMRDAKFIGVATGESEITSMALSRGLGKLGLDVVKKLSTKKV